MKTKMLKHYIVFETQWPRLRELQEKRIELIGKIGSRDVPWYLGGGAPIFGRELWQRRCDLLDKIDKHIDWLMKFQFGEDVQWISTYIKRQGEFRKVDRGSGYQGEILTLIYWYEDE